MGLLQILKSVFGLNGAEPSRSQSGDVDVTVEREPSTDDEDAVKGTDTASTDAAPESPVSEAEPETKAGSESDHEADADSPVEEAEPESPAEDTDEAVEGSDDSVTEINGIGPAYAERLSDVGIETVGELAAADAAEIDAETDLSEKRVADWIEQAQAY